MNRRIQILLVCLGMLVGLWIIRECFFQFEMAEHLISYKMPAVQLGAVHAAHLPQARFVPVATTSAEPLSSLSELERKVLMAADSYLKSEASEKNLREDHRFVGKVMSSPLGHSVSYRVFHGSLPIIGMRIEIQVDRQFNISGSRWNYQPVEVALNETRGKALYEESLKRIPSEFKVKEDKGYTEIVYTGPGSPRADHAIVIPVVDRNSRQYNLVLRADDGALIGIEHSRSELNIR